MNFVFQLVWRDSDGYHELRESEEDVFIKKAETRGFKYRGRSGANPAHRICLHDQPKLSECHGPCYNGEDSGRIVIRYEGPGA